MTKWLEFLQTDNYIGIKKHLREGGDVNKTNDTGESVLMYAMRYGCDKETIELLIENGANLLHVDNEGVSVFDIAITYNYFWLVKMLVENGTYDVNTTSRKSAFTPLMCAVCYGRSAIVEYLLNQGANRDAQDYKGLSASDFAKKMNKKKILEMLG